MDTILLLPEAKLDNFQKEHFLAQNCNISIPNIYITKGTLPKSNQPPPLPNYLSFWKRYAKIQKGLRVCLSAARREIVGSFNISFIQGNFRAIIEDDSGLRSQSNDLISSLGTLGRRMGSNAAYCAQEVLCVRQKGGVEICCFLFPFS
ncbi:hypothetical protein CEXT_270441 [Caerostris extrusa]|uniref:Uncharacterized protein n=1 Tax=Caerostris extrusa TaxID=172846 RepID=A0AAV4XNS1_CAEEX|nr:hypothetical protein CEXT_270441 [Caerostris extrusa]